MQFEAVMYSFLFLAHHQVRLDPGTIPPPRTLSNFCLLHILTSQIHQLIDFNWYRFLSSFDLIISTFGFEIVINSSTIVFHDLQELHCPAIWNTDSRNLTKKLFLLYSCLVSKINFYSALSINKSESTPQKDLS